jgi:hypothetical protein
MSWYNGLINLPIQDDFAQIYPIIQYADDTLLIMPAKFLELQQTKEILMGMFSASTCLHVSYHKSSLIPINVDDNHAQLLTNYLGCKLESLPFTYIGLPLGTARPVVSDLMPLNSRLDKRLSVSPP